MSLRSAVRAAVAAENRQHRLEQKRLRDVERRTKAQAKLSALERARLEVDTYESRLDVLLSVHKEQSEPLDWMALATCLPPPAPCRSSQHELRAMQDAILAAAGFPSFAQLSGTDGVTAAKAVDEAEFQASLKAHSTDRTEWEDERVPRGRVLRGDCTGFADALVTLNPLTDLSDLCAAAQFTVHDVRLAECALRVKGTEVIPAEAKALTAGGKLSVKCMPKGRFHEVFQDYVCGCVLRVARELFGLLPLETLSW